MCDQSILIRKFYSFFVGFLLILMSSTVQAEIRPQGYEVSIFSGYWQGGRVVSDASYSGFALSYHISRLFSLEYQQGWIPTQVSGEIIESQSNQIIGDRRDVVINQGSFNLSLHLSPNRLTPYFNVGLGWMGVEEDTSLMSDVGIGARYFITPDLAIKLSFNMWIADYDLQSEPYEHFSAVVGVTYNFKGKRDIDQDGISNIDDRCPTMKEDADQFEDDDGCPEYDNDEDGIKDKDDKCPNEPEDKDKDRDEDGCPDVDDDEDGIVNSEDQCPNKAEDKDEFQDEDGCPDTDNDGDKILDSKDKCPNVAESMNGIKDEDGCPENDQDQDQIYDFADRCIKKKEVFNGFRDEDGCPDDVPDEIKAVLGHQTMMAFKKRKDKLKKNGKMKARFNEIARLVKKHTLKVSFKVAADHKKKSQALSEKRAQVLKEKLMERGVKASAIRVEGVGQKSLPQGSSSVKNWVWLELVVAKK